MRLLPAARRAMTMVIDSTIELRGQDFNFTVLATL